MEVERLYRNWDVVLDWAPFFLDPSIPSEGRARTPQTTADTPKSPMETRGDSLGIEFRRGRSFTPHTLLALQAGEFARQHGTTEQVIAYHRALFKAYFTDFENLMSADVLVRHATSAGLDGSALRAALEQGTHLEETLAGIEHSYEIGVTGIPTFILNDQYAVVGAQDHATFEQVFERLGARRRETPPT